MCERTRREEGRGEEKDRHPGLHIRRATIHKTRRKYAQYIRNMLLMEYEYILQFFLTFLVLVIVVDDDTSGKRQRIDGWLQEDALSFTLLPNGRTGRTGIFCPNLWNFVTWTQLASHNVRPLHAERIAQVAPNIIEQTILKGLEYCQGNLDASDPAQQIAGTIASVRRTRRGGIGDDLDEEDEGEYMNGARSPDHHAPGMRPFSYSFAARFACKQCSTVALCRRPVVYCGSILRPGTLELACGSSVAATSKKRKGTRRFP